MKQDSILVCSPDLRIPHTAGVLPFKLANCFTCGQAGQSNFWCSSCLLPTGNQNTHKEDWNQRVLWAACNSKIINPVLISFVHGMEVTGNIGAGIPMDPTVPITILQGNHLDLPDCNNWDPIPCFHHWLCWKAILEWIL
jgi:hypothetical protein